VPLQCDGVARLACDLPGSIRHMDSPDETPAELPRRGRESGSPGNVRFTKGQWTEIVLLPVLLWTQIALLLVFNKQTVGAALGLVLLVYMLHMFTWAIPLWRRARSERRSTRARQESGEG
jgi:hypothetical protein